MTDRFEVGGGLEHIYQLVRGLDDIRFRVFGTKGKGSDRFLSLANVEIINRGFDAGLVHGGEPDLIHVHQLRPLLSLLKTRTAHPVPVIYTAHGLHIQKYTFSSSAFDRIRYRIRFHMERRLMSRAERVIAVSRQDQLLLEEQFGLKNVSYLTNGIDFSGPDSVAETRESIRDDLNLARDGFVAVTVARFNFQKGYDILLGALARISRLLLKHSCTFLLVGAGPELAAMKKLAQERELLQVVRFLGERDDAYRLIKAADLFVLPSRWEGLPISLLEAGLLGVPILASTASGNREIMADGNGISFQNLDETDLTRKLSDILTGAHDLSTYPVKMRLNITNHYSLEKMLQGLRKIYSEVIA